MVHKSALCEAPPAAPRHWCRFHTAKFLCSVLSSSPFVDQLPQLLVTTTAATAPSSGNRKPRNYKCHHSRKIFARRDDRSNSSFEVDSTSKLTSIARPEFEKARPGRSDAPLLDHIFPLHQHCHPKASHDPSISSLSQASLFQDRRRRPRN